MTPEGLAGCLRKLEARSHVLGLIWNDAVADSFTDVLEEWEDEFAEEVLARALETPRMPLDWDLRKEAGGLRFRDGWVKKGRYPLSECLTAIPEVLRDPTDHRRARREAFAAGALEAWKRMYPDGTPDVPEWVLKARNFLEGLTNEAEFEPFFERAEEFFSAEKRRQITAEVRAHNNKQTEMTEL